jgi:hypothetical protein
MGIMKKQGTKDFPIIDAFTIIKGNTQFIECNYCGHLSKNNESAVDHFDSMHPNIRDTNFPKKKVDEVTGNFWLVPKEDTIEHKIFDVSAIDYYIHFYGFCMYDRIPLTATDQKQVQHNSKQVDIHKDISLKNFSKPIYTKKRKKKHIYSYNVGKAKIEEIKKKLKEQYKISDDDIIMKVNKKGNFAVFYYR